GQDNALSYFVGLDAREASPQTVLSGDRNVLGGRPNQLCPSLSANWKTANTMETQDGDFIWRDDLHNTVGNALMSDGSAHQLTSAGLREVIRASDEENNDFHILRP